MAHRYRVRTPEDGNLADPRDLMDNLNVLIGEFNGGLDADNIPETSISSGMILQGAFTAMSSNASTTDIDFKGETTEWRKKNHDGTVLQELTIITNVDALLEVHWSGTWERRASGGGTPVFADLADNDFEAFRVMVNGKEVARLQRSSRSRFLDSTYLVGAIPVQGGTHTVHVEIRQWQTTDAAHERHVTVDERELIAIAYKR